MQNNKEIESQLRSFVLQNYLFTEDESALKNEDSFLTNGIIDSMGMLELIHFLEDTFQFKVQDKEMIPENLDSINRLLTYIGSKKS